MTLQYSRSLATNLRNAAKMIQAENQGAVVLKDSLRLMMSPSRATEAANAFFSWYRTMYDKGRTLDVEQEVLRMPPLRVCGLLSEFANLIDEIADTAEILDAAANLIKAHGWVQGSVGRPGVGFDLVGAVEGAQLRKYGPHSASGWRLWTTTMAALTEYLQTTMLVEWNDAPGRTANEVYGVLKEVAAGIRSIKP